MVNVQQVDKHHDLFKICLGAPIFKINFDIRFRYPRGFSDIDCKLNIDG